MARDSRDYFSDVSGLPVSSGAALALLDLRRTRS